jgi:hypothetical protein
MKHPQASRVEISLATRDGSLLLSVRDDGVGGADPARGSGLAGLTDRVEALGGSIHVHSAAGAGTHITVDLPLEYELARDVGWRKLRSCRNRFILLDVVQRTAGIEFLESAAATSTGGSRSRGSWCHRACPGDAPTSRRSDRFRRLT